MGQIHTKTNNKWKIQREFTWQCQQIQSAMGTKQQSSGPYNNTGRMNVVPANPNFMMAAPPIQPNITTTTEPPPPTTTTVATKTSTNRTQ